MSKTFVMVHGAWHGAWAWDSLVSVLKQQNRKVVCLDSPSSGSEIGALGNLQADVDNIINCLDKTDGQKILVGHSYGGIPITQASSGRNDIDHLVYVAAFMLDESESLAGALGGEMPDWIEVVADGAATKANNNKEIFYTNIDQQIANKCSDRLDFQSMASFGDELSSAGWKEINSSYIICKKDNAIPPPAQEAMSQRATNVHKLDTDHSPFLSKTEELAKILLEI